MSKKEPTNTEKLIELVDAQYNIIIKQQDTIKNLFETVNTLNETIDTLNEVIDLKDQTMDKQLQMLQLLELKLKEFGYELGDAQVF